MTPTTCEVCGATPVRQWFNKMLCGRHVSIGNDLVRPRLPCHDGECREEGVEQVAVCWECAGYGTLDRAVELMKRDGGKER